MKRELDLCLECVKIVNRDGKFSSSVSQIAVNWILKKERIWIDEEGEVIYGNC